MFRPRELAKTATIFLVLLLSIGFASAQQHGPPPKYFDERLVIKAMVQINSAQATYRATSNTGSYATLGDLRDAGFIDAALTSGQKYGYHFTVVPTTSAFTARATPVAYKKSGLRSYYIDQRGILFGEDLGGLPASDTNAPYVDTCALWGISDNESCTVVALRTLHSAQMTYAATIGNGEYAGSPRQLHIAGLIDMILAQGVKHGYNFHIQVLSGPPPTFQIRAVPVTYGGTGTRSFFVDQTGVVRGADRQGDPAEPSDPPVN